MLIINTAINPSGAYSPPQTWNEEDIPEGYAIVSDALNLSDFFTNGGFVTITIVDNIVTSFTPNTSAWEAWKKANPEAPRPPTEAERIAVLESKNTALNSQLAQSDDAALALYEAQAATDEAILAIYEKIGGTTV